jgi:hypothetical protein
MAPLPELLDRYPDTQFLVDEAFIGMGGQSMAYPGPDYMRITTSLPDDNALFIAAIKELL